MGAQVTIDRASASPNSWHVAASKHPLATHYNAFEDLDANLFTSQLGGDTEVSVNVAGRRMAESSSRSTYLTPGQRWRVYTYMTYTVSLVL